jgi:micrococcal nuclease
VNAGAAALAALALALAGCAGTDTAPDERTGRVTRVVDGDTIKLGRETVRLLGIDTPESGRPNTPVECGAKAAGRALRRLLDGREVVLTFDPSQDETDRFGRTLAYVSVDGRDAGEAMIAAGWAKPYVYQRNEFERVDAYRAAQRRAQAERAGVFGACGGDFHRAG